MEKDSKKNKAQNSQQPDTDNDGRILTCLRLYTRLTSELYQFQAMLYEKSLNLPRQIFRHFRTIRDVLENTYSTLQSYVSFNQDFLEEKDRILQEQILLTESQMTYSQLRILEEEEPKRKRVETDYQLRKEKRQSEQNASAQVDILKGEIQSLKNELRKNDFEYEIQIKKYNAKYEQMMDEISFYQQKMGLVDEYEETIEHLEVQLRIMKETKERDDQLIRNMARKIKNFEIEKNGRSVFVSPSKAHQSYLSPSRVRSQLSPKHYSKIM